MAAFNLLLVEERRVDIGTIVGILAGIGLTIGSILMGATMGTFINAPGLLIVVGGTFASAFVAFPLGSVFGTMKASLGLFGSSKVDFVKTFRILVQGAETARTGGGIALEKVKVDDAFVKQAFQLIADGYKSPEVQALLTIEIEATLDRSQESVKIMEKMGELAPAWGMIGTLIGLVMMLVKLDDPSSIGPAMAVALLTTFYGALLANLLFIPGATKLEDRAGMEQLKMKLIAEGAAAIARNENPRQVQQRLMGFMPPEVRSGLQAKKRAAAKKK